jgi:hypothetical protein
MSSVRGDRSSAAHHSVLRCARDADCSPINHSPTSSQAHGRSTICEIAPTRPRKARWRQCANLGESAAHAPRTAVCRPPAGHRDPALARPGRRNSLLCLFADDRPSFATGAGWLRAVWAEHHRFCELHEYATTYRGGTQGGGKTERRYDAGALKRRGDLARCVA